MNIDSWGNFHKKSNHFQKPERVKGIISKEEISKINKGIVEVLINFLSSKNTHIGLKVFVESELRSDIIENWTNQIFGNQKFGMILIGLEQYSNLFAEKVATIVKPLLVTAGLPLNGLSFLFFMGNYGFTPLDIHKEPTREDGFLFHLGSANKNFYTWDSPKSNAIEFKKKSNL